MTPHSEDRVPNIFHHAVRSAGAITIFIALVIMVASAIDKGPYIVVNTIVTGGMWALMAMGLALVFGVMNVPSFAHGEFFMIGSLVSFYVVTTLNEYLLRTSVPLLPVIIPLMGMFAACVAGCIAGALCEIMVFRPLRRRSQEQWVMNTFLLTLGLSIIMINGHQLVFGTEFKGIVSYWDFPSVEILGTYISFDRLFVFVLSVIAMICFWSFMKFSRSGQAIRAVSQDEAGALMVGINLDSIQMLTLCVSCGLAALAGASLLFMYPSYPSVGLGPLYNSWFIVILAGLGNVAGAAVGAFIVALFQILTTVYIGEGWGFVIPSALIILVLTFKPSGIFGSVVRGIHDK